MASCLLAEGWRLGRTTTCVVILGLAASCGPSSAPTTTDDRRFNRALSQALARRAPIDLAKLETGPWSRVCIVGEDKPSSMLPQFKPRPGEMEFDTVFDAGESFGLLGGGAVAFVYPDGVEVRPITGMAVGDSSPLHRCIPRAQAWIIYDQFGWRFRDAQAGAEDPDAPLQAP
jgi:hypothetical protein